MLLKPARGADHAERLESFYAGQADSYDGFRKRLLPGREDLYQNLPVPEGGIWVDLGGGTGANLELLGPRIETLRKVYLVDLSPSLLTVPSGAFSGMAGRMSRRCWPTPRGSARRRARPTW